MSEEQNWTYTAEKHAKTMERIFEAIHDIHLIVTRNEGKVTEIKESMDEMKKSLHGSNGNQGVIGMVGSMKSQLGLQWILILGCYAFTTLVLTLYLATHIGMKP